MGVPDYAYEKLVFVAREHEKALRIAIKKGVQIALGTDLFSSGEGTAVPWGMNAQELLHLVDAGMTPLQALQSATANGPHTLGPQARDRGNSERDTKPTSWQSRVIPSRTSRSSRSLTTSPTSGRPVSL
ncbi:MAG: amidohydrolase family protein [Candidatus Thermoplasmatota archaeon]|nr:amidohydrolase family protein [Candidatus Thermoplasmatota archaeon]